MESGFDEPPKEEFRVVKKRMIFPLPTEEQLEEWKKKGPIPTIHMKMPKGFGEKIEQ